MSSDLAAQILSFEQIESLTDEQIVERIRLRVQQAQSAFIEIGKLFSVLKKRHESIGKQFKPYVHFKEIFDNGTISNASLSSSVWMHYVENGHLAESDFEELKWKQVIKLDKARKDGEEPQQAISRALINLTAGNDSSVRGQRFEDYILIVLRAKYATFAWTAPGALKRQERGLDFIGSFHDSNSGVTRRIGVQVKFHKPMANPSAIEWLQFLAGCYVQGITESLFITTGRLTSDQLREAGEARITVVQGRDEINRMAKQFGLQECPEH